MRELTERDVNELTSGGDTRLHHHLDDRTPTRDTLLQLFGVFSVREVSASTSVVDQDDIVLVDTTAGSVTMTLPPARNGRELIFKKMVAANNMILDGDGAETIDGSATLSVATSLAVRRIKAYSGNWIVIGGYL